MQKKNRKFTVYETGLVVNPSLPFLGASPDGKVFDPTEVEPFGLLEIKAPFTWRNNSFLEACQDNNFTCHVVDGQPWLKVNQIWLLCPDSKAPFPLKGNGHDDAQIQGQLALSGLPWCDFVVFLTGSRNINAQRIYFDALYWEHTLLPKFLSFYFDHALPFFSRQDCLAVPPCSDTEIEEDLMYTYS